jgi:16S rRNA C967 or C1407 C5-methylase (RsmB/RsmF family)
MTHRSLIKVADKLFDSVTEKQTFIDTIASGASKISSAGQPTLLWLTRQSSTELVDTSLWSTLTPSSSVTNICKESGLLISLLSTGTRPGLSTDYSKGLFYPLDLSSIILSSVLTSIKNLEFQPPILDLCAAPGGKSIIAYELFGLSIIANEVENKRISALISNLERCKIPGIVTSLNVNEIAKRIPYQANLVILDAPCSGQSLLAKPTNEDGLNKRKNTVSFGAFHPSIISMNVRRQRHLLAKSAECVAPGGYLAYLTCTFSREENEGIMEWFLKRTTDMVPIEAPILQSFRSTLAPFPCYRVWPGQGHGAGGFAVLLAKHGEMKSSVINEKLLEPIRYRG